MKYENIKCEVCGCSHGSQIDSHIEDAIFIYACDGCDSVIDDEGRQLSAAQWAEVVRRRRAYDEA